MNPAPPDASDRHDWYELCCQHPPALVTLLESLHAGAPRSLHEDFCGTAAVSRTWLSRSPHRAALGLDLDAQALAHARSRCPDSRLTLRHADVLAPRDDAPADVIFAGNFSVGELHARADLLAYFRSVAARLAPSGIFACDTFGGAASSSGGVRVRTRLLPDNRVLRCAWEQGPVDPRTARAVCRVHFRLLRAGEVEHDAPDAFVYSWRIWSIPELADAMHDAGLSLTRVVAGPSAQRSNTPDAPATDSPLHADEPPDPSGFTALCVATRAHSGAPGTLPHA